MATIHNGNDRDTARVDGFPAGKKALVVDVPADGTCMFHAVFTCFYHAHRGTVLEPMSQSAIPKMRKASHRLRLATVAYVLRHYRRPLGGAQGNSTGRELVTMEYVLDPNLKNVVKGPKTYAQYMSNYATFGGETELHAMSAMLKCAILVHSYGTGTPESYVEGQYINAFRGAAVTSARQNPFGDPILHLHFDAGSEHYAAIIPV